ncbi:MAG: carbon-nitrogen hydrolase family protein [bacterium]|nr:carbon-nitrogen hydrolase family protein [bacterium]MCP4967260.1 carbon-nitrogen hydrolase family protein [bacterium]
MIRVAAVQAGSIAFDTPATMRKLEQAVAEASAAGANLVVFPEAFVGGYPKGHSFGAVVGSRTEDGRDWFRRYYEAAIDLPGPEDQGIGQLAREHDVTLSVGLIERDGGTLYCTVVFYGPDGMRLGKHRKLMPTAAERLVWGFGDGSTMPVVDSPAGKLGAAICWENYLPLYRTTLYDKGVQVWCAPTVDDRDRWSSTMQHIALEGRCFVISANQYSLRSHYPDDYDTGYGDDPTAVLIGGGSCIVDPHGTILAGPARDGETILYADIDLSEIVRGTYDLDVVGHYARPDVFQLHVNESRQLPVVATERDDVE